MFYQEKLINGKLMYRTVPNGVWYECSNEYLTKRFNEMKDQIEAMEGCINSLEKERDKHLEVNVTGEDGLYKEIVEYFLSVGGVVAFDCHDEINFGFPSNTPNINKVSDRFGLDVSGDGSALMAGGEVIAYWLCSGSVSVYKYRIKHLNGNEK